MPKSVSSVRSVILTNYRRPWNMAWLLDACRAVRNIREIILVDNSDLATQTNLRDLCLEDVTYIRPETNLGSGHRFYLAAKLPDSAVMCIDDDLLITPGQIEVLFDRFEDEPDRLHGLWGENIRGHFGSVSFRTHLFGSERTVDILNRLYVFSPAQAARAIKLAEEIGFLHWREIGPGTDILMSFAGARRPICHDVGPIKDCETTSAEGIAIWRRPGFYQQRAEIVRRLRKLKSNPGSTSLLTAWLKSNLFSEKRGN